MTALGAYLTALGATLAIEAPVVVLFAPARRAEALAAAIAINLVSHPCATLLASGTLPWSSVECLVALSEALALRWALGLSPTRAVLASFTANALSALLAFFLF